jgi:hypothetical protein
LTDVVAGRKRVYGVGSVLGGFTAYIAFSLYQQVGMMIRMMMMIMVVVVMVILKSCDSA